MDKGYSGLRRTRKRAHSSKCPCCYSSEEEEGHHAITKKEKIKDSNHNNGKPTRTRKRKLASDEDDSTAIDIASSPADSVDENQNSKKPQKTVVSEKPKKKGASRNSTISHQESAKNAGDTAQVSEQGKKQSGKARKAGSKKKTRTGNKDESERGISLVGSEHGLKKLPSNELHSTSRKVRKRKKNGNSDFQTDAGSADKNELEFKDKSLKSKKNAKTKASTSSKNIGAQKVSSKDIGSSGLFDKGTLSVDTQKPGTKNNNTGKYKQDRPSRGKNSKSGVVSSGLSWRLSEEKEHTIPLESNKHPNGSSSIHVKRKIEAFDHLFSELKKCPGFSKITVSSAAETLLKLTADKLKIMLPSVSPKKSKPGMDIDKLATDKLRPSSKAKTSCTLSERKRRRTDSEKSSSVSSAINTSSCLSSPKKTVPVRGEEAKLSQAAEALVSFRANPTILRQEKTEAEVWPGQSTDKDIVNASTQKKSGATQSSVVKSPLETVTSAEALTVSKVIDSINDPLQGQVASQPWSTLMQGALNQTMRFPTRSEADMQQIATVQQSMVNLNQVTSQLNSATTVPTPVIHTVSTPRTASLPTSGMNSIMMSPVGVQNIQALLCRPTQPSTLQTPVAQTSAPPLSAGGNNQQLHPQQPLKGMENVVSCVGSRTATNLLWNIKPATAPVVYLTSPQTLSGVRARNLIPQSEGHITLPLTTGMGKVQSVGITKTSLSSTSSGLLNLGKVTFVNQAVPLSVATVTGQRPILPREQRLPSLLPSVPQTASQMPVTTVVGPIPHNIPPVPVGSIPVQFSSLGVNTSLSAQQTSNSNVVMQAPVPEVTITQATVTQSPLVQVACVTTTQPTNLTPVSAKQAVKKFVHERTKSAELKRSSSLNSLISNECITSTAVPERPQTSTITPSSSQECQSMDQSEKEGISHQSMEFNLHQAASALLSISSQDVLDTMNAAHPGVGEGEDSMDEHDDEVVFTSKGVFRVGDVDVDPKYNRIGREGYTCGKCGKIFTSLSYLARHIKRVCPDMSCRKWKCTMCDKAFRHPFGLQQHIYTHTGERPHKCSQCPKAFYSSNDLRRHSRIHSGERPYHCKHCDKSFATTISLKTHTYIHTGEKPHKCPHCPKTFATSSKLGRHIVTHSEQRPFACDHCPKSFNRSGDLRRHNMHVHECREKPFEFEGCVTPPSTASNLTEDMTKDLENVTRQVIHCSVCEEMFDSSSDLGLHMLSHDVPDSLVQDRNA